jgi:hypothetical protein
MDIEIKNDLELYEEKLKKLGFKKVKTYLGNDKFGVRYLPNNYLLRSDEEIVFDTTEGDKNDAN